MKEDYLKKIARELRLIRFLLTLVTACIVLVVFFPGVKVWIIGRIEAFSKSPYIITMLLVAVAVFVVLYIVNKIQSSKESEVIDTTAREEGE